MTKKVGDTIEVTGVVSIKDETRTDNKISKLLAVELEEKKYMYARIYKGEKLYDTIANNIKSGNRVTIVGELKSIKGEDNAKIDFMGIDSIALEDEKNFKSTQIIREDAKGAFVEAMSDAFEIDKLRLNFIKYDTTKVTGQKQTANIPIYLDINEADAIMENILNGHYAALIKAQKIKKERGEITYYSPIAEFFGGVSAKTLAKRGQAREDGKALARVFRIEVSTRDTNMLVLTAQSGPGIENKTGGITPEYGAKDIVTVSIPLTQQAAFRLALATKRALMANETAQAVARRIKEGK